MTQSFGIDASKMMEDLLVDELSKSINEMIILDLISPETKHITDTKLRRAMIERDKKINTILGNDDNKFNFDI
jgi:hypothetical protein